MVVSNSGSHQITVVSTKTVTSTLITAATALSTTCPAPSEFTGLIVLGVVLAELQST